MGRAWKYSVTPGNADRVRDAALRGLAAGARHVMDVSQRQVPIDDGHELHDSADVALDATHLRVRLSYGSSGISRAYAARQHEQMDLEHDPGRKAKFLEDPMNSERRAVAEAVAEEVRRELHG